VRVTTGTATDLIQVTRDRFDVDGGRIIVSG